MKPNTVSVAPCGCVAFCGTGAIDYEPCDSHDLALALESLDAPPLGLPAHRPGVTPMESWAERWAQHQTVAPTWTQYAAAVERARRRSSRGGRASTGTERKRATRERRRAEYLAALPRIAAPPTSAVAAMVAAAIARRTDAT